MATPSKRKKPCRAKIAYNNYIFRIIISLCNYVNIILVVK